MPRFSGHVPWGVAPLERRDDACSVPTGVPAAGGGVGSGAGQADPQISADLGISASCLRRWMAQADVDEGKREGVTTSEREELARLRKKNRVTQDGA